MQLMMEATINWDPLIQALNGWIAFASRDFLSALVSVIGASILIGFITSAIRGIF
jgi:hypothetical protein